MQAAAAATREPPKRQNSRKGPPNRSASESAATATRNNRGTPQRSKSGRGGVNRTKSGRGGGNNKNNNENNTERIVTRLEEVELHTPSSGSNEAEKQVTRHSLHAFFSNRMQYLDPPPKKEEPILFDPHERCSWSSESDRLSSIEAEMQVLWDFKPLDVNDGTRWKARVMEDGSAPIDQDSTEEILRKATAILNKLSWTTIGKLNAQFLETLKGGSGSQELSREMVHASLKLIVEKSMAEPHFAELYANFSGRLADVHKVFRKTLLNICQEEFERTEQEPDTSHVNDEAERQYILRQSRKSSVGLMSYIGELYKLKLIKGHIMISCLQRLLDVTDEERLECLSNLMTTVGKSLGDVEDDPEMQKIWASVSSMAGKSDMTDGPKAPTTRIKFLLQDLLELKGNDWVARREGEKAKTIAQIHKEVAAEERAARRSSGGRKPMNRSKSVTLPSKPPAPPVPKKMVRHQSVDDDGFTEVTTKPKKAAPRRSSSESLKGLTNKMSSLRVAEKQVKDKIYLAPKEVADKTKSILKEYFVGGDTSDASLSLQELVSKGSNFDVERGTALIKAGVFLVLEMKDVEVTKFLTVVEVCMEEKRIPEICFAKGLMEPLEFLRDIQIDAPLAQHLLARIMADWITHGWISLGLLKSAPDYFLSDGRPEELAKDVLHVRGGNVSDIEVEVVTSLLSEEKRQEIESVRDWIVAK